MSWDRPGCQVDGCSSPATGRCALSNLAYCEAHLWDHSRTGNEHDARRFPDRLISGPQPCPDCGGPTRSTDQGTLIACRAKEACGWMQVAEAAA